MITIDGADSSHDVVEHLEKLNTQPGWSVAYSVGFDLDARVRAAIGLMPADGWEAALDAAGKARDDAQVAELTGLLREGADGDRLDGWPTGMRILARREEIEEGRQLSLFEQINGYRYQVIATATCGGQPQRLEARHRVHARVEGFIRCGKDTGLAKWPSHSFAINTAWITAAAIAIEPAVLDAAAAALRPARQGRARHAALPAAARRRPPRPPRPPADPPHTRNLALGTGIRRRGQPRPRHPRPAGPCPIDPKEGVASLGQWNPASPHDTRRPPLPSHQNQNPTHRIDAHHG